MLSVLNLNRKEQWVKMVKAKITVYTEKTEHPAKPDVVETANFDDILPFLTSHGVDPNLAYHTSTWCICQKDLWFISFNSDTCLKVMRCNFMVELFDESGMPF